MKTKQKLIHSKKAAAMTFETLTKAIIAFAVFLIVMGGLFILVSKIAGVDITKTFKFGAEKIEKLDKELPKDIELVFDNLVNAFSQRGSDCLVYMSAINADFKEYRIVIKDAPDGSWIIVEKKEMDKFLEVRSKKTPNRVCFVAGKDSLDKTGQINVAEKFYERNIKVQEDYTKCYNKKIEEGETAQNAKSACSFYLKSNINIDLTYSQPLQVYYLTSKYKISYKKTLFDIEDNNLKYDGKEIDLLYKPKEGLTCFFPTFNGDVFRVCDANEKGLDDDCLKDLLPGGKYNPFDSEGKTRLPFCSGIDSEYESAKKILNEYLELPVANTQTVQNINLISDQEIKNLIQKAANENKKIYDLYTMIYDDARYIEIIRKLSSEPSNVKHMIVAKLLDGETVINSGIGCKLDEISIVEEIQVKNKQPIIVTLKVCGN